MTLLEYFEKKTSVLGLDLSVQALTDLIEINGGVVTDEMTDKDVADVMYLEVIRSMLLSPSSVSEGQYSISYDKDALVEWYKIESERLGVDPGFGSVKDMSFLA